MNNVFKTNEFGRNKPEEDDDEEESFRFFFSFFSSLLSTDFPFPFEIIAVVSPFWCVATSPFASLSVETNDCFFSSYKK